MWIAVTYDIRKGKKALGPFSTKMQHLSVESALERCREVLAIRYPGATCTITGEPCDPPTPEPRVEGPPPSIARAAKRAKIEAKISHIASHKGIPVEDAKVIYEVRRDKRRASLMRYATKHGLTQDEAVARLKRGRHHG
jgi:hypothetical protein